MTLETEDLLQSILDSLDRIDYIRPDDIPDIELYMDQVTTFMDSRLKNAARNPEVDKILTKTMINNYAKNDLLLFFFKQKTAYEIGVRLVGSEMCIRDRIRSLRPISPEGRFRPMVMR